VFGALVTASYIQDPDLLEREIFLYNDNRDRIIIGMVFLWIMMAVSILFLFLDINLVLFHIFLVKRGLTTFQYVSMVENRKEQKREKVIKVV